MNTRVIGIAAAAMHHGKINSGICIEELTCPDSRKLCPKA